MRKKKRKAETDDDLRPEYDLSKLKFVGRGIYAKRYHAGPHTIVLLEESKKVDSNERLEPDDLRPEYDFSKMRIVARGPGRTKRRTTKLQKGTKAGRVKS